MADPPGSRTDGAAAATAPMLGLLRQLAIGLSIHRLYAGTHTDAFAQATERIGAAADDALAAGATDVHVRTDGFVGAPGDAGLMRLADACFRRRVEHLRLIQRPTSDDLDALFTALSADPEEVQAAGGVGALLHAGGVGAIATSDHAPDPTSGEDDAAELLPASERSTALDDAALEQALAIEVEPDEDGLRLLERLRAAVAGLPDDTTARSPFYRHANAVAARLSPAELLRFDRAILGSVATDPFAERYVGHLTDVALADLVLRVARHHGWDPREVARQVAVRTARQGDLPRLVLERAVAQAGDAPTGGPTVLGPVGAGPASDVDVPPPATHPLLVAFPDDAAAGRRLAMTALVDLLANSPRDDHLEALQDAVAARVRDDLRAGDTAAVRDLIDAVTRSSPALGASQGAALTRALGRDLDVEAVVGVLDLGADAATTVLRPLAADAIAPLVGALEPDQRPTVRRAATEVLRALSPHHLDALAGAIAGRNAAVVREVVDVAQRIGGAEVVGVLGRAAHHGDPAVLERVVDVLARLDVSRTPSVLAAVITRTHDRALQRRCLEVLGASSVPTARAVLERLGTRGTSPLPGRLRSQARTLARERRR